MLALSETWLNDDMQYFYSLPQYNAVHFCIKNRRGGGVSVFIHEDFEFIERKDLSIYFTETEAEAVFIEISKFCCFGGQTIVIGCIYRPPDNDVDIFNEALSSTLEMISAKNKTCIHLGDYNIYLLKHELNSSVDFLNTLYTYHFYPVIHKPTRITRSFATLIDNILTNYFVNSITSGVMLTGHLPVFLFFHQSSA